MGWFDSRSTKQRKTAVMSAILAMLADGKIDEREKIMLAVVCARVGVTENEMKEILAHPERIEVTPPDTAEERFFMIADAVGMMLIDGDMDSREFAYCSHLAISLGYDAKIVPAMIESLMEAVRKNADPSTLQPEYSGT